MARNSTAKSASLPDYPLALAVWELLELHLLVAQRSERLSLVWEARLVMLK